MGTQQILLIVIGVVVVGVAVAVGIMIFNNAAYNSNLQAVTAELANYSTQIIQYWKTPISLGGAGQKEANLTVSRIATYLAMANEIAESSRANGNGNDNGNETSGNNVITNNTGQFKISRVNGKVVTLIGLGKEQRADKKPLVTTKVDVSTGEIDTTISAGDEI